jgi:hypothetical protein
MDVEYRWTLLGLCAMTVALVAPQIDLKPGRRSGPGHQVSSVASASDGQAQESRDLVLDRSFDVAAGGMLSVSVGDGDVEVRSGGDGSATVKVYVEARDVDWGREVFERMRFSVGLEGDRLTVRARDANVRDYERGEHRGVGVLVQITVPERFDLDVRTADGDVDIGRVDGRVDIRTSDGDIVVGELSGPELSIETSDGDVTAESLRADRITVRTSDGDVKVSVGGNETRITTGDGDINLELLAEGEVALHTGDGDITVYADPALRADLELHGGDVNVQSEIQIVGRIGRSGARGQLNGGGPLLVARTGDGTITIREARR